jgi:hypothetical protein
VIDRGAFTHSLGGGRVCEPGNRCGFHGGTATKPRKLPKPRPDGEARLARDLKVLGLPPGEEQHPFATEYGRTWKFDRAWPDRMLAVEIVGKPHTIKERFAADCERELAAQALGWRVIRFSPAQIRSGLAVRFLAEVFADRLPTEPLIRVGILTPQPDGSTVPGTPRRGQSTSGGPRPRTGNGGRR